MKIETLIPVYETGGKETAVEVEIVIRSHGIRDGWVILELPGLATSITVAAEDLKSAVGRCSGWKYS